MPQVLLVAATGMVAYAAWRLVQKEMQRVSHRLAEVRVEPNPQIGVRLVRGIDGIYRPER